MPDNLSTAVPVSPSQQDQGNVAPPPPADVTSTSTPPGLAPQPGMPPSAGAILAGGKQVTGVPQPGAPAAPPRPKFGVGDAFTSVLRHIEGPPVRPKFDTQGNMTMEPVPPERPGALFRSILAGAIAGGSAAQEAHNKNPMMGFGGGMAIGADAAMKQKEQQLEKQKTEAQKDWSNNQEQLKNASNIALQNTQTHELLLRMSGTDHKQHQEVADEGKLVVDSYAVGGILPIMVKTEDETKQMLTKDPSLYMKYRGVPFETETSSNPDGSPKYEFRIAFFDKSADVTVTPELRTYFKNHGVFEDPAAEKVLQVGKHLEADVFNTLMKKGQAWTLQNLQNEEVQGRIAKEKAETALYDMRAKLEKKKANEDTNEYNTHVLNQKAENAWGAALDAAKKIDKNAGPLEAYELPHEKGGMTGQQKIQLRPALVKEQDEIRKELQGFRKPTLDNPWSPEEKQDHDSLLNQSERFSQLLGYVKQGEKAATTKSALTSPVPDEFKDVVRKEAVDRFAEFAQHPGQVLVMDVVTPIGASGRRAVAWVSPDDAAKFVGKGQGVVVPKVVTKTKPVTAGQVVRSIPGAIKYGAEQMIESPGKAWNIVAGQNQIPEVPEE